MKNCLRVHYRFILIFISHETCTCNNGRQRTFASFLTHWDRDTMAAIFQTTFWNAFSWMKIYEFRLKFHWSLFLGAQLTIYQHWFRKWLGADQATSHYLNQWWLIYWPIYASLGLNELNTYSPPRGWLLQTPQLLSPYRVPSTFLWRFANPVFHLLQIRNFPCLREAQSYSVLADNTKIYRYPIIHWITINSYKIKQSLTVRKLINKKYPKRLTSTTSRVMGGKQYC